MPFFIRANPDIPMEVLPRYARQRSTLMDRINIYNVNDLRQEDLDTMTEAEQAMARHTRNMKQKIDAPEYHELLGHPSACNTAARNGVSGYPDYHGSKFGDFVMFKARGCFERGPSADTSAEELNGAFQRVPSSVH
eukprot:scaffold6198_cov408-Prasinococcus_capsulatus_cf.AAC.14